MELSIDHLSNLPVDLLLQQLTYLPFEDVVSVCKSNSKLHFYCINPKYNNNWKAMIDNTFSGVYNYEDKLNKIWAKLHLVDGTYNYLVYTKLIKLLDPLTQLMIYYRQGDTKSFNRSRFLNDQRFLTMFLLNKPEEMKKYKTNFDSKPYYLLLEGKIPIINDLNEMLSVMAASGNVRGVKYLIEMGADIHANNNNALRWASHNGYLDVVKYLVEQGADIHANTDDPLRRGSTYGHLDVVRYLVEHGADIHALNDDALRMAKSFRYLDVVKYLEEQSRN